MGCTQPLKRGACKGQTLKPLSVPAFRCIVPTMEILGCTQPPKREACKSEVLKWVPSHDFPRELYGFLVLVFSENSTSYKFWFSQRTLRVPDLGFLRELYMFFVLVFLENTMGSTSWFSWITLRVPDLGFS